MRLSYRPAGLQRLAELIPGLHKKLFFHRGLSAIDGPCIKTPGFSSDSPVLRTKVPAILALKELTMRRRSSLCAEIVDAEQKGLTLRVKRSLPCPERVDYQGVDNAKNELTMRRRS